MQAGCHFILSCFLIRLDFGINMIQGNNQAMAHDINSAENKPEKVNSSSDDVTLKHTYA